MGLLSIRQGHITGRHFLDFRCKPFYLGFRFFEKPELDLPLKCLSNKQHALYPLLLDFCSFKSLAYPSRHSLQTASDIASGTAFKMPLGLHKHGDDHRRMSLSSQSLPQPMTSTKH